MKNKLLYLGIGALTIAMASCSNDYLESLTTSTAKQKGLITATVENNGAATRVGFDSNGKFYWTAGDKIGIATSATLSYNRATFVPLTLADGGAGKATASFEGEYEGTIGDYAIYPYYNDGKYEHQMDIASNSFSLYYYLPKSYTYDGVDTDFFTGATTKKQSFNPPMYGKITTDDEGNSSIDFKYLGGIICVKIPKIPVSSGALVVTSPDSNNYPLAGEFMASNYNGQTPVLGLNSAYFYDNVTINFSGAEVGEDAVFYIPAPPLTFSTITIELVDNADTPTKTYAAEQRSNVTVDRGMLYGIILDETSVSEDSDETLYVTASTIDEANAALASADNVVVTLALEEYSSETEFKIPAVTSPNASKKIIVNKFNSTNLRIWDYSEDSQSVGSLTVSLPSMSLVDAVIYMPNSTVSIESNVESDTGSTKLGNVIAVTSENTLIVNNGVSIEGLSVQGNVIVKDGGYIGYANPYSSTSPDVYIIVENGGSVNKYGTNVYNASKVSSADGLKFALTYDGDLSAALTEEIEASEPIEVIGNKVLDLNGKAIKISSDYNYDYIFKVKSGASLTIKDSVGGGTMSSYIIVEDGGTLN
jgi:hypothetical protein